MENIPGAPRRCGTPEARYTLGGSDARYIGALCNLRSVDYPFARPRAEPCQAAVVKAGSVVLTKYDW